MKKNAITEFHKEHILAVAEQFFLTKGFENTTIDDISTSSSYSRRTIYAYFSDKQDIVYHAA